MGICSPEILRALVLECSVPATDVGTMRLQSSHCEACDFEAVIANIDHGAYGCFATDFKWHSGVPSIIDFLVSHSSRDRLL